jgi:TolB protein
MRNFSHHLQTRLRLLLPLAVLVLSVLAVAPAGARTPGHNGRIAFARFDPLLGDRVPYTINPDGTNEQQLLPFPGEGPRWSPDGSRIAMAAGPGDDSAVVANPDDGSYVELARTDHGLDTFCFVWSPDGARLACEAYGTTDGTRNGMYSIRSSDGGGLRQITTNGSPPWGGDIPGDYSPDGKRLVFSHFGEDCACLSVVKANGTGVRRILRDRNFSSFGSWSPQGNEIVFSMHITDDVHSTIWVMHSDGSGLHQINVQVGDGQYPCGGPTADDPAAAGCFDPKWSPDGKKIVFVYGAGNGNGSDIYTVNADGSGLTQVTHDNNTETNEDTDWGTHPLVG